MKFAHSDGTGGLHSREIYEYVKEIIVEQY